MTKPHSNNNIGISIIIPIYNSANTLTKCLSGLSKCFSGDIEIILVDNNSTDNSLQVCNHFKSRYPKENIIVVEEMKKGPAAARNSGVAKATGDWLLFTDADCMPSPDWVLDFRTHFNNSKVGAVAGCIQPYPPTNLIQKTLALFTLTENKKEVIHNNFKFPGGLYPTANLAVRKNVFEMIGGFNEDLKFGEDHELCYKTYKSGNRIKVVTDAIVEHIHRKKLRAMLKQSFFFGTAHPYELRHFTKGGIVFNAPLIKINKIMPGIRIWIDINQADKKLIIVLLLGLFWFPLYALVPIYFLYLCTSIRKTGLEKRMKIKFIELPFLALLLIIKSFCLTLGRILYSYKHRVVCL
ncbi:glycosyltransferase [Thermodesulfobacteriota bacterium]